MHVVKVTSRQGGRGYVSHLLRNSYREGGKVKKQTVANLSHLPLPIIDLVRRALGGESFVSAEGLVVERSLPHGHVAAVLGMVRQLGLDTLLDPVPSRWRELAIGLLVLRVLHPCSKLATAQRWSDTTLADCLGVEDVDEDELYAALDWLGAQQEQVEAALAQRHLLAGSVVLYDVTSTYVTGKQCPLAAYGYSRDHRRDREQIVCGLVLDGAGRPLGVEAFAGNTADPTTVERQVDRLQERYRLEAVVLVGDRGMLTQARIERLRERGGIDWIICLRAPAIRALAEQGAIQLSLFDQTNLVEITHPSYPGERLVVCRNPLLKEERARKREELLQQTEAALAKVQARVAVGRLQGSAPIGVAVGKVIGRWQMAKHFETEIEEQHFAFRRDAEQRRWRWTGCTLCAPACPKRVWTAPGWWPRTRAWRGRSGSSEPSKRWTCRCGRSFTTGRTGSEEVLHAEYRDIFNDIVNSFVINCADLSWKGNGAVAKRQGLFLTVLSNHAEAALAARRAILSFVVPDLTFSKQAYNMTCPPRSD